LGVARDLVASLVDKGLNLPDAAAFIRGDVRFEPISAPQPPVATVTLAEIYGAQGHLDRALGVLDEVLAKEPEHAVAQRLRDRLAREQTARKVQVVAAEETAPEELAAAGPETLVEPLRGSEAPSEEPVLDEEGAPETPRMESAVLQARDSAAVFARAAVDAAVYYELGPAPPAQPIVRVVEVRPRPEGALRVEYDVPVEGQSGVAIVPGLEPGSVLRAALGFKEGSRFRALAVAAEVGAGEQGLSVLWAPRRGVDYQAIAARLDVLASISNR
jgi:hypothetical protein